MTIFGYGRISIDFVEITKTDLKVSHKLNTWNGYKNIFYERC